MKLTGLIFGVVILTVRAISIDDTTSADQCTMCSDFIDFIADSDRETEYIPNKFFELLILDNLQETCMDECGFSSQSFLKLAGCDTCIAVLNVTALHSHGFDFSSIKYSLQHSCADIKGVINTVKCKLFVKIRERKIIQAIYKHKKDSKKACHELEQC